MAKTIAEVYEELKKTIVDSIPSADMDADEDSVKNSTYSSITDYLSKNQINLNDLMEYLNVLKVPETSDDDEEESEDYTATTVLRSYFEEYVPNIEAILENSQQTPATADISNNNIGDVEDTQSLEFKNKIEVVPMAKKNYEDLKIRINYLMPKKNPKDMLSIEHDLLIEKTNNEIANYFSENQINSADLKRYLENIQSNEHNITAEDNNTIQRLESYFAYVENDLVTESKNSQPTPKAPTTADIPSKDIENAENIQSRKLKDKIEAATLDLEKENDAEKFSELYFNTKEAAIAAIELLMQKTDNKDSINALKGFKQYFFNPFKETNETEDVLFKNQHEINRDDFKECTLLSRHIIGLRFTMGKKLKTINLLDNKPPQPIARTSVKSIKVEPLSSDVPNDVNALHTQLSVLNATTAVDQPLLNQKKQWLLTTLKEMADTSMQQGDENLSEIIKTKLAVEGILKHNKPSHEINIENNANLSLALNLAIKCAEILEKHMPKADVHKYNIDSGAAVANEKELQKQNDVAYLQVIENSTENNFEIWSKLLLSITMIKDISTNNKINSFDNILDKILKKSTILTYMESINLINELEKNNDPEPIAKSIKQSLIKLLQHNAENIKKLNEKQYKDVINNKILGINRLFELISTPEKRIKTELVSLMGHIGKTLKTYDLEERIIEIKNIIEKQSDYSALLPQILEKTQYIVTRLQELRTEKESITALKELDNLIQKLNKKITENAARLKTKDSFVKNLNLNNEKNKNLHTNTITQNIDEATKWVKQDPKNIIIYDTPIEWKLVKEYIEKQKIDTTKSIKISRKELLNYTNQKHPELRKFINHSFLLFNKPGTKDFDLGILARSKKYQWHHGVSNDVYEGNIGVGGFAKVTPCKLRSSDNLLQEKTPPEIMAIKIGGDKATPETGDIGWEKTIFADLGIVHGYVFRPRDKQANDAWIDNVRIKDKGYFKAAIFDESLKDYIDRMHKNNKKIPDIVKLRIAFAVATAIKQLHDKNFLHRDIKPENIMLSLNKNYDLQADIIDYGLLIKLGPNQVEIQDDMMGSYGFTAPEIQVNNATYSKASDIFALGITLKELGFTEIIYAKLTKNSSKERISLDDFIAQTQDMIAQKKDAIVQPDFQPNTKTLLLNQARELDYSNLKQMIHNYTESINEKSLIETKNAIEKINKNLQEFSNIYLTNDYINIINFLTTIEDSTTISATDSFNMLNHSLYINIEPQIISDIQKILTHIDKLSNQNRAPVERNTNTYKNSQKTMIMSESLLKKPFFDEPTKTNSKKISAVQLNSNKSLKNNTESDNFIASQQEIKEPLDQNEQPSSKLSRQSTSRRTSSIKSEQEHEQESVPGSIPELVNEPEQEPKSEQEQEIEEDIHSEAYRNGLNDALKYFDTLLQKEINTKTFQGILESIDFFYVCIDKYCKSYNIANYNHALQQIKDFLDNHNNSDNIKNINHFDAQNPEHAVLVNYINRLIMTINSAFGKDNAQSLTNTTNASNTTEQESYVPKNTSSSKVISNSANEEESKIDTANDTNSTHGKNNEQTQIPLDEYTINFQSDTEKLIKQLLNADNIIEMFNKLYNPVNHYINMYGANVALPTQYRDVIPVINDFFHGQYDEKQFLEKYITLCKSIETSKILSNNATTIEEKNLQTGIALIMKQLNKIMPVFYPDENIDNITAVPVIHETIQQQNTAQTTLSTTQNEKDTSLTNTNKSTNTTTATTNINPISKHNPIGNLDPNLLNILSNAMEKKGPTIKLKGILDMFTSNNAIAQIKESDLLFAIAAQDASIEDDILYIINILPHKKSPVYKEELAKRLENILSHFEGENFHGTMKQAFLEILPTHGYIPTIAEVSDEAFIDILSAENSANKNILKTIVDAKNNNDFTSLLKNKKLYQAQTDKACDLINKYETKIDKKWRDKYKNIANLLLEIKTEETSLLQKFAVIDSIKHTLGDLHQEFKIGSKSKDNASYQLYLLLLSTIALSDKLLETPTNTADALTDKTDELTIKTAKLVANIKNIFIQFSRLKSPDDKEIEYFKNNIDTYQKNLAEIMQDIQTVNDQNSTQQDNISINKQLCSLVENANILAIYNEKLQQILSVKENKNLLKLINKFAKEEPERKNYATSRFDFTLPLSLEILRSKLKYITDCFKNRRPVMPNLFNFASGASNLMNKTISKAPLHFKHKQPSNRSVKNVASNTAPLDLMQIITKVVETNFPNEFYVKSDEKKLTVAKKLTPNKPIITIKNAEITPNGIRYPCKTKGGYADFLIIFKTLEQANTKQANINLGRHANMHKARNFLDAFIATFTNDKNEIKCKLKLNFKPDNNTASYILQALKERAQNQSTGINAEQLLSTFGLKLVGDKLIALSSDSNTTLKKSELGPNFTAFAGQDLNQNMPDTKALKRSSI